MPAQPLSPLTAGLVPDRDQAQPLLTYVDGPARVELSAATTANWVSKTANMLTDSYGVPERVGLHLPLHWQVPCLLLGAVAAGCTVVVATEPEQLAGCAVAFTTADAAGAALDAGVDDVLVCSLNPFGTRLAEVPPLTFDAATEIPVHGDHFGGRPTRAVLEVGGAAFDVPLLDVGPHDRVLTRHDPRTAEGLAALLAPLRAGASLVLLRDGDLEAVVAQEGVTRVL